MTSTANPSEVVTDLADEVMFADPFPRYRELRLTAPVSRVLSKQLVRSGGAYMVTRYDDVQFLYGDVRFSSEGMGADGGFIIKHLPRMFRLLSDSMVFKDDPDHARLRRLVNKAFTPRVITGMADDISDIVDRLIGTLNPGETVDLVSDFATPFPLSVISNMLGVSDADRDEFQYLTARFVKGVGGGSMGEFVRTIPTARKLLKVIERLADERRAMPDDGMITALVTASENGDKLSVDEVVAMIFLLMLAGHDTTSNLIGSSIAALLEHPDQAERLRQDEAIGNSAVEELLRFTSPVPTGTPRVATEDIEIGGMALPRGTSILGMIISANRDETVFDRPDDLDLARDPNRHLAFAFGKHFCLGNQLARMEGQIALRALLQRFPDMQLAVPRESLRYKRTQSLRGLSHLPLRLR